MVLTTMDGEWFLDDMCLMTEVSIKLASYILNPSLLENNPGIHLVTKCLDLLHGIYKRLQVRNQVTIFTLCTYSRRAERLKVVSWVA